MDWSSFPSDFLAGVLGTMVGLVVGLRIDHVRERRRAARRDERLIQSLIDRLASKRAFSHGADVGLIDDPDDRERCIASVLDVRRRTARVCDALEVREDAVPLLRRIESDCMAYLNHVERNGPRYAIALIRLRDRLHEAEQELGRSMPGLEVAGPGSRTPSTPQWLA